MNEKIYGKLIILGVEKNGKNKMYNNMQSAINTIWISPFMLQCVLYSVSILTKNQNIMTISSKSLEGALLLIYTDPGDYPNI
jgi:hypothetical protein